MGNSTVPSFLHGDQKLKALPIPSTDRGRRGFGQPLSTVGTGERWVGGFQGKPQGRLRWKEAGRRRWKCRGEGRDAESRAGMQRGGQGSRAKQGCRREGRDAEGKAGPCIVKTNFPSSRVREAGWKAFREHTCPGPQHCLSALSSITQTMSQFLGDAGSGCLALQFSAMTWMESSV